MMGDDEQEMYVLRMDTDVCVCECIRNDLTAIEWRHAI